MVRFIVLACLTLLARAAAAQPSASDPAARRQAMQRLAFLVGEWSGDARTTTGPGRTLNVRQTESVRFVLGGQALVIEGVGRELANGVPGDTVFHAFGVLDWRPERGYQLRSMTLEGREGVFPVEVATGEPAGISWGFEVAGGRTRFIMRIEPDGTWHERGEFSRDGTQWFPTMELRVRRTR